MDTHDTLPLVRSLAQAVTAGQWTMATAGACTGGLIAAACTELAGSSAWFDRGVITYSNEAKSDLLGVDPALIAHHGAVSEAVVRAMVEGVLARSPAQVAVAVSGIAGPTGGSADKPVGTVWLAFGSRGGSVTAQRHWFEGDRMAVRKATVLVALQHTLKLVADQA